MYCYRCGKEIEDDAEFCRFCGTSQDASKKQNEDSAKQDTGVSEVSVSKQSAVDVNADAEHKQQEQSPAAEKIRLAELRDNYDQAVHLASKASSLSDFQDVVYWFERLGDFQDAPAQARKYKSLAEANEKKRKKITAVVSSVSAVVVIVAVLVILWATGVFGSRESPSASEVTPSILDESPSAISAESYVYGNTSGNIGNKGLAAIQGDRVYYINYSYENADGANGIYSMKHDGSDHQRISADYAQFINVVGDRIYYVNADDDDKIYTMKTDGTDKQVIGEHYGVEYLQIISGSVYYIKVGIDFPVEDSIHDSFRILCMDADGSNWLKLNEVQTGCFSVVGDRVYYTNNSGGAEIYCMRTDGSDENKLNNEASIYLNVIGDRVFYISCDDGYTINTMKADGSDKQKLNNEESECLNVVGDSAYYVNCDDNNSIYSIKIDGTGRRKLNDDYSECINVVGNWIFYISEDEYGNEITYVMKTDGTDRRRVSDFASGTAPGQPSSSIGQHNATTSNPDTPMPSQPESSSNSAFLNDVTYKGIEVSRILDELPESTVGTPTKIEGPYYFYDGLEIYFNGYVDLVQGTKLNLFDIDGVALDKNRAELIAAFGNPVEYYEYDDYTYSDSYYGDSMMRYHVSSYIAEYMLDFWFDDPGDKAYLVSIRLFGQ